MDVEKEAKFLNVSKAARLKKVARGTVYRAIAAGELSNVNRSEPPVLLESEVLAWEPQKAGGRRNTKPMTRETKAKLSESQKRRWAGRKENS